ncbi:rhomboid family intramembrane serine protease [Pedobacter endophyticus]|uniref:Rhomboid family intramembrane serine protease n=1 Tax=Pedobacter endophyticus TaxID=2789740 RepID=A0A7U3SNX7_9SPHI|nr:rhomboid family intramembrane serine protease [Pedobacter endophyticus]QPH37823.1 rhomboid family intramembrane serine protease [Pedobacter endophyticus]
MEYFNIAPVASLIFVFTVITSLYAFYDNTLYGKFMLHPYSVSRGHKVWTVITNGFIHADWMHLIFNMFTFVAFAFTLERLMGSWQFGLLYFLTLILSDLPTVFRYKHNFNYNSLGASGAVSAVLFSYILFNPLAKLLIFPIPFGIPALVFGPLYLIYCAYASRNARDGINHDAHFYGALTGLIFTILFVPGILQNFITILFR